MAELRRLPADVFRCQNHACVKRETCMRYLSPPHEERQVYAFKQGSEGCEDYIELNQETQE